MSTLSAFPFIGEQSFATPGAINSPLSIISANIAAVNAAVGGFSGVTISPPSGNTITIGSNLSVTGQLQTGGPLHVDGPVRIGANSNLTNYLYLSDVSNLRSNYIIGSQVGGTADGLNIWDDSGQTMIVSFSKQSVRFYQQVVGPVFDVGGALADTLNAATFGTGADSIESRIQAAISAASAAAISRVYLPASMYPYSAGSISFDSRVQMVREGGNWSVYDVQAYGATGNGTTNDSIACQSATAFAPVGATVFFPSARSRYRCSNITVLWRQNIVGEGRASELFNNLGGPTILIKRHSTNTLLWNSENQLDGMEVRGLFFNGNRGTPVAGLRLERLDHSVFENLHFEALQGPALHLASIVRESAFVNITTRWCGSNATTPAVLLDDGAGSVANGEGHNALNFFGLRVIFSHGPGLLIETTGSDYSNAQNKTRDIQIYGYQLHGPLLAGANFDGTIPFPDSGLTHPIVVLKSCRDVRFLGGHTIVSGQSCAHFDLRGGTGTNSGCTGIVIAHGSISGHAAPSTGTVTNGNSGVSVNAGCGVYLDNLWINAYQDIIAPSTASVHLGLNVDLQGTPSINSLAYEPPNRMTGVFQPRSGEPLIIDEAYRLSVGTVKASSNAALLLEGSVDNNVAPVIIRTMNGAGVQAPRMRFASGTAPEIVSLATLQVTFPLTVADGTATNPTLAFSSETSLGFYRSAASTIIQSYGTFGVSTFSFVGSPLVRFPNGFAFCRTNFDGSSIFMDVGTVNVRNGTGANTGGRIVVDNNSAINPSLAFASDTSLGLYRSGVSTVALSFGTFNLATNSVRLSMRTIAASALTASAANTNVAVNECVFTVSASGASFAINSGGTTWVFNSDASAKNT